MELSKPGESNIFVPPIFKDKINGEVDVKVFMEPQANPNKKRFTMAISWEEDLSEHKAPEKVTRKYEHLLKCDGPCNKEYHPNTMHSMGRCDHYVCSFCYDLVHNFDGSIGCSAFQCVQRSMNNSGNIQDVYNELRTKCDNKMHSFGKDCDKANELRYEPSFCNMLMAAKPKEIEKKKVRTVRAAVYAKDARIAVIEGTFPASAKLKRVIGELVKKASPDLDFSNNRTFVCGTRDFDMLHPVNQDEDQVPLDEVKSNFKTVYLVIDAAVF